MCFCEFLFTWSHSFYIYKTHCGYIQKISWFDLIKYVTLNLYKNKLQEIFDN